MRIPLNNIIRLIPERPDGYYEDVLSRGIIIGSELELSEAAFAELHAKYASMPVPVLSLKEKLSNFAKATEKWVKHGFPIVTEAQLQERAAQCEACEHWQREKLIPTCAVCGCVSLKHELATESCPLKKWLTV